MTNVGRNSPHLRVKVLKSFVLEVLNQYYVAMHRTVTFALCMVLLISATIALSMFVVDIVACFEMVASSVMNAWRTSPHQLIGKFLACILYLTVILLAVIFAYILLHLLFVIFADKIVVIVT